MPDIKLPTNFHFWDQAKPSNFDTVIEANLQKFGPGQVGNFPKETGQAFKFWYSHWNKLTENRPRQGISQNSPSITGDEELLHDSPHLDS